MNTIKNNNIFKQVLKDVTPLKKKEGIDNKLNTNLDKVKKYIKKNLSPKKVTIDQKKQESKTQKNNIYKTIEKNDIQFLKKIKKGKIKINKTIDLHGMSLAKAEKSFNQNIENCFFLNQRCLLFITGKGLSTNVRKNNNKLFFGKLRASIKDWVYNKDNQEKILYFAQAHDKHGGQGSFYIYLRKNKN